AYALLLDVLTQGWTRSLKATDNLSQLLKISTPPITNAESRAATYNFADLRSVEEKRDRENRERVAAYRALLVDGPTIELPMANAHFSFDPNHVVLLGDAGNAHPTLSVSADWGTISTERGARIASDFTSFYFAADDRAKLKLNEGWTLVPGKRPLDLRVSRKAP